MLQNANKNQKLTVTIYTAIKMKRPSYHRGMSTPPVHIRRNDDRIRGKIKGKIDESKECHKAAAIIIATYMCSRMCLCTSAHT